MDINIGTVILTSKQETRVPDLISDLITGIVHRKTDGNTVINATRSLSVQEIADFKAALAALPDAYPQSYYEGRFSFHMLMGRLNQTLEPASIIKLAPFTGALQSFCDWKNWEGISAFLDGLVAGEIATAEEVSHIVSAFAEQGIILNA